MARIELDKVNLTFKVRQHGRITLKEFFVRHLFRKEYNPFIEVHALKEVSLSLGKGDRLGVIGHNGAGKSTLMRVLAGIYPPTSGNLVVEGNISSLFDISLGFEPEASGWENICYRGYLQGETPKTIRSKMQEIADFSELGSFLDMPVRYYSAGMMVRLAFSVMTAIEPEVLLVDEVLSVGDMAFQNKAKQRMLDMMNKAQLIVMISHDLLSLRDFCNRVLWMDHGQVREIGQPHEVIHNYYQHVIGNKGQAA
jgi:ABC-type polysaccharide/polyol phosphate transport system ATPase subunit